jgi:uncharacterized membrane protein
MNHKKILGYIFGMLTALCWAISSIFIFKGLQELPSSIWGTAIGLAVSTILYLFWYFMNKKWKGIPKFSRKDLNWQMIGGVTGGLGILFRNIAIETTRVAVVLGLIQMSTLFTLILAPILLGKNHNEQINRKLIFGVLSIVSGLILVIIGRNS